MSKTVRLNATLDFNTDVDGFTGPLRRELVQDLVFSDDLATVDASGFQPLTIGPFDTDFGPDTLSVTRRSGGIGRHDPANGTIEIPITLHFQHSLLPTVVRASDLPLTLITGTANPPSPALPNPAGQPVQADGTDATVALVAAATFKNGYLDGKACTVVIAGRLTPAP